jgi:2-polyprenyl-3-methyl-5-hydroxy-6-metoxy-1,4-benzoquinol methylase
MPRARSKIAESHHTVLFSIHHTIQRLYKNLAPNLLSQGNIFINKKKVFLLAKMHSAYEFKPDNYSSHMKIARFLATQNTPLRILDVGCSKGFMGKLLHQKHELHGIDINKQDLTIAKHYYKRVLVVNIEKKTPPYPNNSFDAIIMADVLEHLRDPPAVLEKLRPLLKKKGMIIISVPNVANLYVRLKLLFGNFDYGERGILDKTHLRFFTLRSFHALLMHAGLDITKEESTPIPFPTIHVIFSPGSFFYPVHLFYYWLVLLWKRMFAFQFIAYCRKR